MELLRLIDSVSSGVNVRFFTAFLLFILSLPVWSQVKHLVFDLEGVLVQGIPAKNYNSFSNKDQMIRVNRGGRNYHYYILPYVSQLLNHYQKKQNIVIHIASHLQKSDLQNILTSIKLPKPIDSSLAVFFEANSINRLLTAENKNQGKWNLKEISSDLDNVVFITATPDSLVADQKANELYLGKPYFYFESFIQAQTELAANPSLSESIPSTNEEWSMDQSKLPYLYHHLRVADVLTTSSLTKSLASLNPDKESWTSKGLVLAKYNFEEEVVAWKFNEKKDTVVGCGIYSTLKDQFTKDIEIDRCIYSYSTKKKFHLNHLTKTVDSCELLEESQGASIRKIPLSECIAANTEQITPFWQGLERVSCAEYFQTFYFLRSVDAEKCKNSHIIETSEGNFEVKSFYSRNGVLIEGISEIMDIPVWSTLSRQVYDYYDTVAIAEALNQRIHNLREIHYSSDTPYYDFKNDSSIVMAVNFAYIDLIIKNGFLNQHQTGTTKGCNCPDHREKTENDMVELKLEPSYGAYGSVVNELRPKYSHLMLDKPGHPIKKGMVSLQYGNLWVKFKESVKTRATFTPFDSLAKSDLNTNLRTFNWSGSSGISNQHGYWESQIWGKLTAKEIEYVMVNCPGQTAITSGDIQRLKNYQLEVYQCHGQSTENSRYSRMYKGKKI
jgi:hypothetical protein